VLATREQNLPVRVFEAWRIGVDWLDNRLELVDITWAGGLGVML